MRRVRWYTVIAVALAVLSPLSFPFRLLWPGAAKCIGMTDPAPTAQYLVLAATLVYLWRYVISTEQIALATIEPVITFELISLPMMIYFAQTKMTNKSPNHARCWLTLDLRVNGAKCAMPPGYDGTGEWLVQAHGCVTGQFDLVEKVGTAEVLGGLLAEQRTNPAKSTQQITLDITVVTEREDRRTPRRSLGPMRYYFTDKHRAWVLDSPWPRAVEPSS